MSGSFALAPGGRGACFWGWFFRVGAAEHHPGSRQSPSAVQAVTESGFRSLLPPTPADGSAGKLRRCTFQGCPGSTRALPAKSQGCGSGFRPWVAGSGRPPGVFSPGAQTPGLEEAVRAGGNKGGGSGPGGTGPEGANWGAGPGRRGSRSGGCVVWRRRVDALRARVRAWTHSGDREVGERPSRAARPEQMPRKIHAV